VPRGEAWALIFAGDNFIGELRVVAPEASENTDAILNLRNVRSSVASGRNMVLKVARGAQMRSMGPLLAREPGVLRLREELAAWNYGVSRQ
jgi:hypothetical protein